MKTFEDVEFTPHLIPGGIHAVMHFDNGYGVSVVKTSFSYGGNAGYYEIGILYNGELTYSTPITDNVIGWADEEQVTEIMKQVQQLKG